MANDAIHVIADDALDDWIVRDDGERELGHCPTRETAELVAQAIERRRRGKLVIHLPDGRTQCKSFAKGCLARLLAR
jgi:Uncharacterized protein conserved in bacteria (DUF2188)